MSATEDLPGAEVKSAAIAEIRTFREELARRGVRATVRFSHGDEVHGACGQLINAVNAGACGADAGTARGASAIV